MEELSQEIMQEIEEINGRISLKKKKIDELYYELGKYTYEKGADERDTILSRVNDEIDKINVEIGVLNVSILDKKGFRICPCCNEEVDKKLMYCGNCGTKMPVELKRPENGVVCEKCGSVMGPDVKFCTSCGNRIAGEPEADVCPTCGKAIKPNAVFCVECGTKVR